MKEVKFLTEAFRDWQQSKSRWVIVFACLLLSVLNLSAATCPRCRGTGMILGPMLHGIQSYKGCPDCGGSGGGGSPGVKGSGTVPDGVGGGGSYGNDAAVQAAGQLGQAIHEMLSGNPQDQARQKEKAERDAQLAIELKQARKAEEARQAQLRHDRLSKVLKLDPDNQADSKGLQLKLGDEAETDDGLRPAGTSFFGTGGGAGGGVTPKPNTDPMVVDLRPRQGWSAGAATPASPEAALPLILGDPDASPSSSDLKDAVRSVPKDGRETSTISTFQLDETEKAIRKQIEMHPNDPQYCASQYMYLAQLLHEKGDNAAAVKVLDDAVRLSPNPPPILKLLQAKALADAGDLAGAEKALRDYTALDPENKTANKILADLQARQKQGATVSPTQGADAKHVGIPNLPGLAINDGKQPYGIPGLPGIYTGGPGPGSGLTPQNKLGTDGKIVDSSAAPVPGLSPVLTPQLAAQPPDALQQQADASKAAVAAPTLDDASLKARAGFDSPLGSGTTQPVKATTSGGTATPGADTKAGDQLVSTAASGQNSGKNFDSGGGYAGSLPTPGAGGTGYSDPSVVDVRGKQGIVDPPILKGNLSGPVFSAPGKPLDATISSSGNPPKNFYQIGAGYTGPISATLVEPSSHFRGALDKKLARFQGTLDAMYAAGSAYNPDNHPPGYSILQRFTLVRNGTEAVLYGKMGADGKPVNLILAFRGTSDQNDWTYGNIPNGFAKWLPSSHGSQAYVSSVLIARLVQKEFPDSPITLAGHSLGGGEAALAAVATGLPAITFNATGVNPSDYGYSTTADTSQITNYHLSGEPLTTAQSNLTVPGTPPSQYTRILPTALGNQIAVTPVDLLSIKTSIKSYLETNGWHSMGAVEPAIINYLSQL